MKLCTRRRPARRAVGAAGALAASFLLGLPAAAATPTPTPAPTPAPRPATRTSAHAVLIVHVAPSRSVRAVVRGLGRLDVRHSFGRLHAFSVQVPAGDAGREAARLSALPGVTGVERGVERHFADSTTPNDRYFARQAAYLNAVHAPLAWTRQHPSTTDVRIAVLDSGINADHGDLRDQIATVNGTYNAHDGSTDATDEIGHGTFVAGVAAARTGNGYGVAGASDNDAQLYVAKIADPDGAIELDDEIAGIRWAISQHVDVINLSLGGPDRSSAEAAAIADAQQAGIVVVAAAGNESDTAPSYPAAYPGVIAVGATDTAARTRAAFSNYGSWVTVAAPGVDIFSTLQPGSEMWPGTAIFGSGDGTSFSTPLVAGEVALLKAQNPHATPAQLRHAVVASAHGFAHLGLGAGQVDFAGALTHLPPASIPADVTAVGQSGRVQLTAHSTAHRVAFRLDSDPRLRSVPVVGGVATTSLATWGLADGPHVLRAYDCTANDECSYRSRGGALIVNNPRPVVTSPITGTALTGRVVVTATSAAGGPLRLLVDGHPRAILDGGPYAFPLSLSDLRDGAHTIAVQGCSTDHHRCAGAVSDPVAVQAQGLHPRIAGLSPAHVSPNADHVHDTATLSFELPDRESVTVRVLDDRGGTVRSAALGSLEAGAHSWVWRPVRADGRRLPDGRYSLVLDTVSGALRGWVARAAIVDTTRPALARPSGSGTRFYPYRDGFRDDFTPRTRLGEAGTLTLTVWSAKGRVARTLRVARSAGAAGITWNGRWPDGRLVPPGTYRWRLTLTDAAGNATSSAYYRVQVSGKRLVTVTRYVTRPAASAVNAGGTARCAYARTTESAYTRGLRLVNACPSSGFDLAYADYVFTLPAAMRYRSLAFQVRGGSRLRPSELSAAFSRLDGSIEIPRYLKIDRSAAAWYTIGAVPAAHHVGSHHRARMSLLLDSFFAGRNDFDAASVRLRVRMTALQ